MQFKRFVLKFSRNNYIVFLILCVAALCFCQELNAQSGRRTNKGTAPSKPQPPAASDPKIDPPNNTPPTAPPPKISSLILLGTTKKNAVFSHTSYLDTVFKECVKTLEDYAQKSGAGLTVTKGDKMGLEQAIERAKKETDDYILWLELSTKFDGNANEYVEYLDYAVITPQTGTRLTSGRSQPGRLDSSIGQGGILQLPSARARRQISSSDLRIRAREIVNQLIRQEWL